MRMMLIVVPPKSVDLLLGVLERREPVDVQAFFPKATVERFNGRVVGRLTPTTEVQDGAVGAHRAMAALTNRVPLSAVIASGVVRAFSTAVSAAATFAPVSDRSATSAT